MSKEKHLTVEQIVKEIMKKNSVQAQVDRTVVQTNPNLLQESEQGSNKTDTE